MHPHITSTIHNIFTYSQIFFQYLCLPVNMVKPVLDIYLHCCRPLCWVPRAVVEEEVKLADALALTVLIQFFSRFMRSWRCKSIYTLKKKQTISPCIDLLLPFPWHCRRYQGWGNCPDSWAFSVSAGPGESGSSLLSPIITKVMLLMIIFLMLFMIIMVMFMIAISHMMARLMMV